MPTPSISSLQRIVEHAHIPGVSYSYVERVEGSKHAFVSTSLAIGKKSTDTQEGVDNDTQFPASSLSKIVFTYLVLQLVKEGHITLDDPLHDTLQYERFLKDGEYPDKAKQLTARDVLSHTTGLPNFESVSDLSSPLSFADDSDLGKGYSYSGEAIAYLQKVIETKMGKNLESLAKEYVFDRLGMQRSTFLPQRKGDTNVAKVHTEFGKASPINQKQPELNFSNAAGSLLTTADDFSKFMTAWFKNMDDPTFQQAFEFDTSLALSGLTPEELNRLRSDDTIQKFLKSATDRNYKRVPFNQREIDDLKRIIIESKQIETRDLSAKLVFEPTRTYSITKTCGLGWHLYKDVDKLIAYQFGENLNTRSFIAINVTDKKGAAFFTNSEHGMSIATQILSSPDLAPIGNMRELFKHMPRYTQSDEPGWNETFEGMLSEDQGDVERARFHFDKAVVASPTDKSKQQRLEWFDLVHKTMHEKKKFTSSFETFEGIYANPFNEKREVYSKDGALICKEFDREIKLVQISDTDFLPEKNQDFKISIKGNQVSIDFLLSPPKFLFEQSLPESREQSLFFAAISKLSDNQTVPQTKKAAKLESPQDLTQQFRKQLREVKNDKLDHSATEDTVAKNSSPTPEAPEAPVIK